MKNAEELVNAAPSLVQALDADALSLVTKSVEATLLHGKKWEFTKHSERMRPRTRLGGQRRHYSRDVNRFRHAVAAR